MSAVNKLLEQGSYDISLKHKGFHEQTGHMFEAEVILLEEGAKEIEMAGKTIKEVTKMTKKKVYALAIGETFDEASDNALEKAAKLLGL